LRESWESVYLSDSPYGQWREVTPQDFRVKAIATSASTSTLWAVSAAGQPFVCVTPCNPSGWIAVTAPKTAKGTVALEYIDADLKWVWGVTADGQVFEHLASVLRFEEPWIQIPANNDKSSFAVKAWDSVPPGGFKLVCPSASLLDADEITRFTVEESSAGCNRYVDDLACYAKVDDRCKWNAEIEVCEKALPTQASRLPDVDVLFDDHSCILAEEVGVDGTVAMQPGYSRTKVKEGAELVINRDLECVDHGVRQRIPDIRPPCWDNNHTINALNSCLTPEGVELPYCVQLAFTSTTYIVKCGGNLLNDPNCGSFLEVHLPGNPDIITEVRIPPDTTFTSGYRTTIMPLNYKTANRTVCLGGYEIWWVQRARGRKIVESVKPFSISEPMCDWDPDAEEYKPFFTIQNG